MRYSVFLLLVGAFATTFFTPVSIRCAHALGAVDVPDGRRHLHPHPTPRLGGLALFASSALLALAVFPLDAKVAAWLSGGALLTALGVSDDVYTLPPLVKLAAMTAVCALPATFGLAPEALSFGGYTISLPAPLGYLFSLFWVLLLTNAFNLIDGADGLCAALSLVGAFALFLSGGDALSLLLFGTVLGFLPYNLPLRTPFWQKGKTRTRSFLGDTGALFLGYSLAVFSLKKPLFSLATPLFFALPLFDLGRVFLHRLLRGKNPFCADRSHLHHRLAARGYTAAETLLTCVLYALLFASIGLASEIITS